MKKSVNHFTQHTVQVQQKVLHRKTTLRQAEIVSTFYNPISNNRIVRQFAGLPIEHQPFAEITELSDNPFSKLNIDGIFGLGFKDISESSPDQTPFDRLKTQGLIKERVFCLHLNNRKPRIDGELIIGGCDVEADFYVPVSKPGHWQFYVSVIQFTQQNEKLDDEHNKGLIQREQILFTACKDGCQALLDSGSSFIYGPRNEITMINRQFGAHFDNGTRQYVLRCGKKDLPNVVINIEGHEIILKPNDHLVRIGVSSQMMASVNIKMFLCKTDIFFFESCHQLGFCLSGFQEFGAAEGSSSFDYIIGDNALRRIVSIFDMEKKRIGFKPLRK